LKFSLEDRSAVIKYHVWRSFAPPGHGGLKTIDSGLPEIHMIDGVMKSFLQVRSPEEESSQPIVARLIEGSYLVAVYRRYGFGDQG
jgi:hypothetical protein